MRLSDNELVIRRRPAGGPIANAIQDRVRSEINDLTERLNKQYFDDYLVARFREVNGTRTPMADPEESNYRIPFQVSSEE